MADVAAVDTVAAEDAVAAVGQRAWAFEEARLEPK